MADQCPQGYTDVEMPAETITTMVKIGHATWDAEDGVHKLTERGSAWMDEFLSKCQTSDTPA